MAKYLALLRGINVGGKGLVKMADVREALLQSGFEGVSTYIQSGNVLFESNNNDTQVLGHRIESVIHDHFSLHTEAAVFTSAQWQAIIAAAPAWWGHKDGFKHNLLIMIGEHRMDEVMAAVGALKPEYELITPGESVLYQSISLQFFGRATSGKLASNPIYKKMTIRNYNTATKLAALLG